MSLDTKGIEGYTSSIMYDTQFTSFEDSDDLQTSKQSALRYIALRKSKLIGELEEIERIKAQEPVVRQRIKVIEDLERFIREQDESEVLESIIEQDLVEATWREAFRQIFKERESTQERLTAKQLVDIALSRGMESASKDPIAAASTKLSRYKEFNCVKNGSEYFWGLSRWSEAPIVNTIVFDPPDPDSEDDFDDANNGVGFDLVVSDRQ